LSTFERGFADAERAAIAAANAASSVVKVAKQLQKAAADGDIAKLRKAADRLDAAMDLTRQEAANARSAWPYSTDEEEAYLRDRFEAELLETARTEGLRIDRHDERLISFPSVVRILPSERALRIDRTRVTAIRPTKLVALLKANRDKKPKFKSEQFLEVLLSTYRLVGGKDGMGRTIPLDSLHKAMTLVPGAAAEYDKNDFGRDVFLLDRSGLDRTKAGLSFSLPASTGTKGGTGIFSFVAPDGEVIKYYGIAFSEGA